MTVAPQTATVFCFIKSLSLSRLVPRANRTANGDEAQRGRGTLASPEWNLPPHPAAIPPTPSQTTKATHRQGRARQGRIARGTSAGSPMGNRADKFLPRAHANKPAPTANAARGGAERTRRRLFVEWRDG